MERDADGRVVVEYGDGRLEYVAIDTNSDLPVMLDDPFDLIEWPLSLSFDPDESVTVEIQDRVGA